MIKILLVALSLIAGTASVFSQITLNEGESFIYQFSTLPFREPWNISAHPSSPAARLDVRFASGSFEVGDVLVTDIFENGPVESPIASQTWATPGGLVPPPAVFFWEDGGWQDLNGSIRLTALSGTVTVDLIGLTAIRSDPDGLNVYYSGFTPVPEPSVMALFAIGSLALLRSILKGANRPARRCSQLDPW